MKPISAIPFWEHVRYLILLSVLASLGYVAIESNELWYDPSLEARLQQDLGFKVDTPYVKIDGKFIPPDVEVIALSPNGVNSILEQAGLRKLDIPVPQPESLKAFYDFLESHRGHTVSIQVVDWGSGQPLESRAKREIRVQIPPN